MSATKPLKRKQPRGSSRSSGRQAYSREVAGTPPMLILHGIWMNHYRGFEEEIGAGGFDFAKEHGFGHELFNFMDAGGRCYGYVQVKNGTINISKLGASKDAEWIDGILVVWTAPHPDGDGRFIVGWYNNARVYRHRQRSAVKLGRSFRGEAILYSVDAADEDCVLLPPEERVLEIPHNKKGTPGQSSAFFPAQAEYRKASLALENRIRSFIASGTVDTKPKKIKSGWGTPDADRNKRVEDAAIQVVSSHYKGLGYSVVSVEDQNLGWDIEATKADKSLCIEVKGLSGSAAAVEVTPNEYDKIQHVEKGRFKDAGYRLAIVTDALADPNLRIFSYLKSRKAWVNAKTGERLSILPRTAARIEVTPGLS